MTKGAEMQTKARDGGSLEKKRRRETKPNGCTHQQEEEKKKQNETRSWKQNNRVVDCRLTDRQEVEKKMDHFSYRWRQRSAPQPWVQRSCASPAGRRLGPGAKEGFRAETKREKRRQGERRERQRSAKRHHAVDRLG